MRTLVSVVAFAVLCVSAQGQEASTWWHGRYVPADGNAACDSSDALVVYEAEAVVPWETYCEIAQRVEIRDMQGVLLDVECTFPDSPDEGYNDRVALLELADGNVLEYSRLGKRATILRRCSD
jgi:hypothetical protein